MRIQDLKTPALLVDGAALEHNIAAMAAVRPGRALRPHVKAFKSTALARRLADAGHPTFCCATVREMIGMAKAGLGEDLLLANEALDVSALGGLDARITVAVDSETVVDAAVAGGVREVLVDVDVGLPRCGIVPEKAGALADYARSKGLEVRGVMGYEGHAMIVTDPPDRQTVVNDSMAKLVAAHNDVGGDVVSAGGTGTFNMHPASTNEIQAGSYLLMDTSYQELEDLPFKQALTLWTQVISVGEQWSVCNGGLKSLGMDHGNPSIEGGDVFIVSDEHITFIPHEPATVGDFVRVIPGHVDPTVAYHEQMYVVDGDEVIDILPVDLRNW